MAVLLPKRLASCRKAISCTLNLFLFFIFELLMLFVVHSCAPLLVFSPLINMLNQSCGNCIN